MNHSNAPVEGQEQRGAGRDRGDDKTQILCCCRCSILEALKGVVLHDGVLVALTMAVYVSVGRPTGGSNHSVVAAFDRAVHVTILALALIVVCVLPFYMAVRARIALIVLFRLLLQIAFVVASPILAMAELFGYLGLMPNMEANAFTLISMGLLLTGWTLLELQLCLLLFRGYKYLVEQAAERPARRRQMPAVHTTLHDDNSSCSGANKAPPPPPAAAERKDDEQLSLHQSPTRFYHAIAQPNASAPLLPPQAYV